MDSYRFESKQQILQQIQDVAVKYGYVQCFWYTLGLRLLMNSNQKPLPCRETLHELATVNAQFSAQIHSLFIAVRAFDELTPQTPVLGLSITVDPQSFDRYPCDHRQYHSHRLWLNDPEGLPQLSHVKTFRLSSYPSYGGYTSFTNNRPISLRVIFECLARLPAVEELECPWLWEHMPIAFPTPTLRHYTRPWEGPWRDARHDFARAVGQMQDQIPTSLRKAKLWFWEADAYMNDEDQSITLPNLVHPAESDPFSLGLRTLASRLEELEVRAFLTPDFFKAPVSWPRMRRLRVEFHPWRPDGQWYFVGPRGEDSPKGCMVTDEHYPPTVPNAKDDEVDEDWEENWDEGDERRQDMFRTEPAADRIEPLLSSLAVALKGMPVLEEADLFAYLAWLPSPKREAEYGDEAPYDSGRSIHRWGLRYVPGKDGGKELLEWQVGDWRPPQQVIALFEDVGGSAGLEMVWKPFDYVERRDHEIR